MKYLLTVLAILTLNVSAKEQRYYFGVNNEVFNGHFTKSSGLKEYNQRSQESNYILNKLADKFKIGNSYQGIDKHNNIGVFALEEIQTSDWYECSPLCGPGLKFANKSSQPTIIWTGDLKPNFLNSRTCKVNIHQKEIFNKYIGSAVDRFFTSYGLVKSIDNFGYRIENIYCKQHDNYLKQIKIEIALLFKESNKVRSIWHLRSQKPVYSFRVTDTEIKADNFSLTTECCGITAVGLNNTIESILSIDGHKVIFYKWVGLESKGYSIAPYQKFFDKLDKYATPL